MRFGEVEARGIALTPDGRDRYDAALLEVDARLRDDPRAVRAEQLRQVWHERFPATEQGLADEGLAYFTYALGASGEVVATPIVYEDFLPRSAAGIFQSNLTDAGRRDDGRTGTRRDAGWLSDVIGAPVADPYALYAAQQQASLHALPAPERHHLQV